MKKTLEIEIPSGYEVDSFDKSSGKLTFKPKPKDPIERIRTDDDVLADNGMTWERFNDWCEGLQDWERALRFISLLVKSLNGDWKPDFDNASQVKYEPRFVGGSSGFRFVGYDSWCSDSLVGSRLCLSSWQLAEHAGKHFTKWYKEIIVIQ
jgi:hypothetical protein